MSQSTTLADYWVALYSRKWIILAVAISSTVATIIISLNLAPIYEAKASFYVPANLVSLPYTVLPSQMGATQSTLKPLPDEKETGIHIGILKSNDMAGKVRARFPNKDASFFKKSVDFVTSPHFLIDIYVRDKDPATAAAIANTYVDLYREFHREALIQNAGGNQLVLERQVEELRKKLAEKAAEVRSRQGGADLLTTTSAEQLYLNQVSAYERQLNDYMVEIRALSLLMGNTQQGEAEGEGASQVRNPRRDALQKLETKVAAVRERLRNLHAENRATIARTTQFEILEAERRNLQTMLTNAETSLAEARLQSRDPRVEVIQVQTAQPPEVPGFPILTLNGVVAFILGFAVACYNALLLEYLRQLRTERLRRKLDDSLLNEVEH